MPRGNLPWPDQRISYSSENTDGWVPIPDFRGISSSAKSVPEVELQNRRRPADIEISESSELYPLTRTYPGTHPYGRYLLCRRRSNTRRRNAFSSSAGRIRGDGTKWG